MAVRVHAASFAVAMMVGVALLLASDGSLAEAKLTPGQWVTFVAPAVKRGARSERVTVFVPERKPEPGERIPALPKSASVELGCLGAWQLKWPKKSGPRGAWSPSPSGDDRWVWQPSKRATSAIEPHAVPDVAPDYGDEFAFCARAPGETFSTKDAPGKPLPGSWVTLVDGKRTATFFVANTTAQDGDVLPAIPAQPKRIDCPRARHPAATKGKPDKPDKGGRPTAPYGLWVPDPFGSKRWAWAPRAPAPFGLRPTASPTDPPPPIRRPCSWFEDAD